MKSILPLLLIGLPLLASALPIDIDFVSSASSASEPQLKVLLNGEDGVAYYLRQSSDLSEWQLVWTDPVLGTGSEVSLDVPLEPFPEKQFFRMESAFERRARLFVENYRKQIRSGGPVALTINGVDLTSVIEITEDRQANQMVITANGIPNYRPTIIGFDVSSGWNAAINGGFQSLKFSAENEGANGQFNPNSIAEATEVFRIPLAPVYNASVTDTSLGTVGVAINGIPIYNPFEDPNETAAYGRIFSSCCGHPQRTGVYHYHKYPTCLRLLLGDSWKSEKEKCDELDDLIENNGHSPLLGFALDGWPVYGPVGRLSSDQGSKLLQSSYTGASDSAGNPSYVAGSGDLDECNGLISPTPEFPEGIYHYIMSIEADSDGKVLRYINPYFGYDVRNTLNKHGLLPTGWEADTAYADGLQNGFAVDGVFVPGTDSVDTFDAFIRSMQSVLSANGMSAVSSEFETMKIQYPFTIRQYRGDIATNTGGTDGGTGNENEGGADGDAGILSVSPSSANGNTVTEITISLDPNVTPPLPPSQINPTSVRIGSYVLQSVSRSNTTLTGTLSLPSLSTGSTEAIEVTFPRPTGESLVYRLTDAFSLIN